MQVSDTNQVDIQRAIENIAIIRRSIESAENELLSSPQSRIESTKAKLFLQQGTLLIAGIIFVGEIFSGHTGSSEILASAHNVTLRYIGLLNTGILLILLIAIMYFSVAHAAKISKREVNQFIAKHFSYLRNLSFLSDLLIKFSFFSAIILAGKPQWAAPMFMLFTADYLLQGRFFHLPLRVGLVLGLICLGVGAVQLLVDNTLMAVPLGTVILASLLSTLHLRKEMQSAVAAQRE